jgi:DNA repair ATPase RecN
MMEADMSRIEAAAPQPHETGDLAAEMDQLSLAHALHDFEVANARVVDLTQRLIGASRELAAAREELASLQRQHEELRSVHDRMQLSRAYKLANKIWAIRNAL